MLVVILTGGIDLSVGSVVAFAGILTAGLVGHLPIPVAIAVGLAAASSSGSSTARSWPGSAWPRSWSRSRR